MSDDEIAPDLDSWARAHGFDPTDQQIGGATPFLSLGLMDVTYDCYQGTVAGLPAWLSEFSIGSPSASEAFGGTGVTDNQFTLLLVSVDAAAWPRLTVHPAQFSDHDWIGRLLHRDRAVQGLGDRFDDRYRVIAATSIPDQQLQELFSGGFAAWYLEQDDLVVDVEHHGSDHDYLLVATGGVGIGGARLDALLAQTEHVLEAFARTAHPLHVAA
jgi:hypothetical protein